MDEVARDSLLSAENHHYLKLMIQQTPNLHVPALEKVAELYEFRKYKSIVEPIFKDLLINGKYRRPIALRISIILESDGGDLIYPLLLPSILAPGERSKEFFQFLSDRPNIVQELYTIIDDFQQGPEPPSEYFLELKNSQLVHAEYYDNINCSLNLVTDTLQWLKKKFRTLNLCSKWATYVRDSRNVRFLVRILAAGKIGREVFSSRIESLVKAGDVKLQHYLITQLALHGEDDYIEFYSEKYRLDSATLASLTDISAPYEPKSSLIDKLPKYTVPPGIVLKVVDTKVTFFEMLNQLRKVRVIAIVGRLQGSRLLVLQIAVKNYIFIVDPLSGNFESRLWERLVRELNNIEWIIGNTFIHKLMELPELYGVLCKPLNLVKFFKHLNATPDYAKYLRLARSIPFDDTLKIIVRVLLRKRFEDNLKLSDFAQRPIKKNALDYLALSALGVLECFLELRYRFKGCEVPLMDIAKNWNDPDASKAQPEPIDFTIDDFFLILHS